MGDSNKYRENTLYFSSKIIAEVLGTSFEFVLESLKNESSVKFSKTGNLLDLNLFEKIFSKFDVSITRVSCDDFFTKQFLPKKTMICLQKPPGVIFPDAFMRLPQICWVGIQSFIGPDYVLELLPDEFVATSQNQLKMFSNPSFPFFGISANKL